MTRLTLKWTDKRNGDRYWYAVQYIYEVDQATGERKRKQKWRALSVKGKTRRRAAENALRDLERTLSLDVTNKVDSIPVASFLTDYLAAIRVSVKPKTFRSYHDALGQFVARFGTMKMTELNGRYVEIWKAELARRYSPCSVNVMLRALRAALNYAVRMDIIVRSPMSGVKLALVPMRTFPPFISMEEFREIVLPSVTDQRHRVAFCLGMLAGLRRQEAAKLKWSQVDYDRDEIRIESSDDFQTKSGHGRVLPLYSLLRRELLQLHGGSQSTNRNEKGHFILSVNGKPPDDSAIGRAWRRTIASVRAQGHNIPSISYHGLRHSYATWLATVVGLNLKALQALLGHANISTTMVYAHIQPNLAVEQAKRIDIEP